MPRGLPDYYNPDTVVSQRLQSLDGVVAAQLGLSPIDNRGRLIWFDRFGDGLAAWILGSTGTGNNPVCSIAESEIPPASAYLQAAAAAPSGQSSMYRYMHVFGVSSMGLETSMLFNNTCGELYMGLSYDNSIHTYSAILYYYPGAHIFQIVDDVTNRTIKTMPTPSTTGFWVPIKIVADVESGKWVRAVIGMDQFDLSGYSLQSVGSVYSGRAGINLISIMTSGSGAATYLGHIYLTTDEP